MKTRIVYPDHIWLNKDFHELSMESKLLCLYLVTNRFIELVRIYKCPELAICFDLKLSEKKLQELKKEIQNTGLFLFIDEWVYVNNDFSYVDYFGRDRVMEAKAKELSLIPAEILTSFEELIKGLKSGYKPPINPNILNTNTNIINKELKNQLSYLSTIKDNSEELKEFVQQFNCTERDVVKKAMDFYDYCQSKGKTYKDYKSALRNALSKDFGRKDINLKVKKPVFDYAGNIIGEKYE